MSRGGVGAATRAASVVPRPGELRPGRRGRGWAPVCIVALAVMYAALMPVLRPVDPVLVDFSQALQPPGPAHPMGTDSAGRDLLTLVALGMRVSLLVALAAAVSSAVLGTIIGALAGFAGGLLDRIVMRLVDAVNALPHLVLGIVIVAFFRGSLVALIVAISLTHWMQVARVVRSVVLPLRSALYVRAAIGHGFTRGQVLRLHILPAVVPQAMVSLVLLVPHAIWHESTLSFLGLGLPPHRASLGVLLNAGQSALLTGQWWLIACPAVPLIVITWAIAAVGQQWRGQTVGAR